MKTRHTKILILGFILILLIIWSPWNNVPTSQFNESKINTSYIIEYPSKYNYQQIPGHCGAFNTAAAVRALTGKEVDSHKFAKEIGWSLSRWGTLPIGLEEQLKERNIEIETPNIEEYSDKNKIKFLKERLSQEKPIIILGKKSEYHHYMTIFGFNSSEDNFYVYDSQNIESKKNLLIDENGKLPGNKNLKSKELLGFWKRGEILGFYEWYAIVASNKPSEK